MLPLRGDTAPSWAGDAGARAEQLMPAGLRGQSQAWSILLLVQPGLVDTGVQVNRRARTEAQEVQGHSGGRG